MDSKKDMKKPRYLFLANGNKNQDAYLSKEEYKLNSFMNIPVETAQELGYEAYVGINAKYAGEMKCGHEGVRLRNVEIYRNPFHLKEVWTAYQNIMGILNEGGFEVIHCNTPIGGVLGRVCGKKAGVKKVIYTAHGFHFYQGAPLRNWILYYPVERLTAHWTDALLTINKEDYLRAKTFHLRKNGRVFYIPGVGIHLEDFEDIRAEGVRRSLGLTERDFVLISSGDLVANKNYAMAVRVLARFKDENVHLLVCGRGEEGKHLKKLARRLGVEKQVHFLGFRTDMRELLKSADAFLFTSRREGLSRSLMEAMASGLAVIATRIRGNTELIDEKGGFLVDIDDDMAMVQAVRTLKKDRPMRRKMGEHNQKKIHKFSDKVVRKKMRKIYSRVLK